MEPVPVPRRCLKPWDNRSPSMTSAKYGKSSSTRTMSPGARGCSVVPGSEWRRCPRSAAVHRMLQSPDSAQGGCGMARKRSLTSQLYRAARLSASGRAGPHRARWAASEEHRRWACARPWRRLASALEIAITCAADRRESGRHRSARSGPGSGGREMAALPQSPHIDGNQRAKRLSAPTVGEAQTARKHWPFAPS